MQYCSITATEDLALDELWVVYPGKRTTRSEKTSPFAR